MPSLLEKGKDIGEFNSDFLFIVASYLSSVCRLGFKVLVQKLEEFSQIFAHLLKRLICLVMKSGYHALLY
jgi:hypothetical protein